MRYRLKEGVVLFRMCGNYYLFPSRRSGIRISFLVTASEELASLIQGNKDISPDKDIDEEMKGKLSRLLKLGYIEEGCQ